MNKPILYVLPGSHPSYAARRMLEHKGLDFDRVDLIPALHKTILRLKGFPGRTVPAIRTESGEAVQGSRSISRYLDQRVPDPPLFPSDPEARKRVEEAERWGDEVLQGIPRRLAWWALGRDRTPAGEFLKEARLGIPNWLALATLPIVGRMARSHHGIDDESVQRDLSELPAHFDRIDGWIGDGTLGTDPPNAADFQIGGSLRLLLTFEDLDPLMRNRPLAELALRIVPDYPGRFGRLIDESWLRVPQ